MSEEIIIQELKNKETQLLFELNKVRLALQAFISDNINFGNESLVKQNSKVTIPDSYYKNLTYNDKILYILCKNESPMLVDEIVQSIKNEEPELDLAKLHKTISYNLSMMVKYGRIKKIPFNRRVKYVSINI